MWQKTTFKGSGDDLVKAEYYLAAMKLCAHLFLIAVTCNSPSTLEQASPSGLANRLI
jgi:hypothetical protein